MRRERSPLWSQPLRWWSVSLAVLVMAALGLLALAAGRAAPPPRPVVNHAFPTETPQPAEAIVWAVGDGADGSDAAKALAERVASSHPDRVLYLGDVYPRGSAADFRQGFASVYRQLARRIAPTPGNHDWPEHDVGYDPYWRGVTGHPTPPWYRFRLAGWEILALNSEAPHDAGSEQVRWLRQNLAGRGTCRLAFWHRPRFSAGKHGDQGDVRPLWESLRGHAALVVSGHDHNMQRFLPVDGITQMVAGAGGRSRYDLQDDDNRLAFATDRADGALRITLRSGSADLAFVTTTGKEVDSSRVRCSPAA